MSRKALIFLSLLLIVSAIAMGADKRFTLVIDAGHGGHDAGAKGSFSYEKNINLSVALAFGAYVERNNPEVKVIYTRKTDVFVPLHKRADIANRNKADVFISIHTNALPAGRVARGLETYTMGMRRSDEKLSAAKRENSVITIEPDYKQHYEGYDPDSPESTIMFEFIHDKNMSKSVELAKYVQNSVCQTASRPDKGVKQDVFLVLRETSMPACLIELGFITTPDEERLLNDKGSVDNMARGIYQAFLKFKNKYDRSFTVPYSAKEDNKIDIPTVVPQQENEQPVKQSVEKTKERNSEDVAEKTEKPSNDPTTSRSRDPKASATLDFSSNHNLKTSQPQDPKTSKSAPVFKVQILASVKPLPRNSSQFKGAEGIESYTEEPYTKYTIGSSTDYNEIYRLRKTLLDKFPEAFIIAFKNGQKMNVNQAIKEFKANKK